MQHVKNHVFIVNPAAGRSIRTDDVKTKIRTVMDTLGLPYAVETTNAPLHAAELVRRHAREDGPCVFYACGGDGTLNEVVCGAAGFSHAAVTHYPVGTGNDFIRQLGKDAARFSDLAALAEGEEHPVDLLQIGSRYALNVFSMGFDAQVPAEMRKFKRFSRLGSKIPYNLAVVSSLFKGLGGHYEVCVDGKDYSGEYTLVTAMNGQYYGGGFHPAPGAVVSDGYMDVLLAKRVNVFGLARLIGPYAKGQAASMDIFTCLRARSIQVSASGPRPANLDGECSLLSSAEVCIRPGMLRFVLPRGVFFPGEHEKTSIREHL